MTRDEFLQNPSASILRSGESVPVEWVASAWQGAQFRQNVTFALTRSVCKNGDFVVAEYWLRTLPLFLSAADAVELYKYIRDESGRSEAEWRPGFMRAFATHVATFPPSQA